MEHSEVYQSRAAEYDRLVMREDYEGRIGEALGRIARPEGKIIAEFGAGTGRLTTWLAARARFVHAFDAAAPMLRVAEEKLRALGLENWSAQVADHRRIPLADGAADLVISGWSICYVMVWGGENWRAELDRAFAEMRRVARPGARTVLLETLGTGAQTPQPPERLAPYFEALGALGFQREWIRTDYRFADRGEAESLAEFFFGASMLEKIVEDARDVILPECAGLWWRDEEAE